ncbi:transposase [Cryobacterium sp. Y62]|uniref:transposase n=1 Tax=Cryobacterium sp. Y62 TaxID=2048284 RepID=UPI0034CECED1
MRRCLSPRQKGCRPPGFDKESHKRRDVIERCFETFEQWRGVATRYAKLAVTYRGGVILRAITIWLKPLGDTPQGVPRLLNMGRSGLPAAG